MPSFLLDYLESRIFFALKHIIKKIMPLLFGAFV